MTFTGAPIKSEESWLHKHDFIELKTSVSFLNIPVPLGKLLKANSHGSETLLILSSHILVLSSFSCELLSELSTTVPAIVAAAHLYECSLRLVTEEGGF